MLLVLRLGDEVGDILGSKLEIIRSASSGEGGEYLPSGGTGRGCKGAFASSVGRKSGTNFALRPFMLM